MVSGYWLRVVTIMAAITATRKNTAVEKLIDSGDPDKTGAKVAQPKPRAKNHRAGTAQ